jgi:hypothetical protein
MCFSKKNFSAELGTKNALAGRIRKKNTLTDTIENKNFTFFALFIFVGKNWKDR